MKRFARLFAAVLIVLIGQAGAAAIAHQMNLSNARIELRPDRVTDVEVALKGSDVDRLTGTSVYDAGADQVRADALGPASARIADYVLQHAIVMGAGGEQCAHAPAEVRPDGDGVAVRVLWNCEGVSGTLLYRSTVLTSLDHSARQVVLIRGPEGESQALLDAAETEVTLAQGAPPSTLEVMGKYLAAGVEHIFLGYDHIAFLVAVVLWARRLWPVVKIVTSFTVAHSVTLSLAALRIVEIPAEIIEPAIAASIVFVALENFYSRDVDRRWRITFLFGFIHGFGFADALQEFGLPRGALVQALASFNIGVEIGQIVIVSIVVPLLLQVDRVASRIAGARSALVVYAVSGLITVLGCYWFLARTVLA
jgi:hydrogenase/urease accessory protein HupE